MSKHSRGSGDKAVKLLVCEWVRAELLLNFRKGKARYGSV